MNTTDRTEQLDRLLAQPALLSDDGFSDAVMNKILVQNQRSSSRTVYALDIVSGLVAASCLALAIAFFSPITFSDGILQLSGISSMFDALAPLPTSVLESFPIALPASFLTSVSEGITANDLAEISVIQPLLIMTGLLALLSAVNLLTSD